MTPEVSAGFWVVLCWVKLAQVQGQRSACRGLAQVAAQLLCWAVGSAARMLQGLASTLSLRLSHAVLTFPSTRQWVQVGYLLGSTAAVALPLGFGSRFLELSPVRDVGTVLKGAAVAFLMPGISEEVRATLVLLWPVATAQIWRLRVFLSRPW